MLQFIFILVVGVFGSQQDFIQDSYSKSTSPWVNWPKSKYTHSHEKKYPPSREYQTQLLSRDHYPLHDKSNYRKYRKINSRPIQKLYKSHINLRSERNPKFKSRNSKYIRENSMKRMAAENNINTKFNYPEKIQMILGKSFDVNSKSSYIDRRNSLNNNYDISDQFEDNKRNQLSKENDVNFNRKSFLTRFIHKKRVKDYDSAQDSSAFEDINGAYESNNQPKRLSNNYLNSNHSLKNKNKGFLLRKITTVEYIIRNDNEAINFLDEKTKENLLSLLKNLKADNTSFFNNTKFSTEIVDIGHDRGTFKDRKNDLLKTLSEFKENKSRKPQEGLLSAENNPYDHQNAADKQKLPLNNKYILGNFDELPNNLNKNLNDVDNEYEKKLSGGVQIIPETAHKDNKKKFRYNNDYYLHNNDKILSNIPKNSNKHINGYDKDLDEDVQSFPEKSDVADKQKFHFTNDYYPGNTKELPSNTNKNSNEHHYESGKILPEDVQGVPETDDNENSRYNYDNYPGNNDRLPSKINKNPNNDIIKLYKANKEDDYPKDETSTHMKYQSRKPSLKAYLVSTQTISDYSSTTSYESARQGAIITSVETTPRNKLNEMSTKNVADHTVQDETSTKFNLLLLEIPETVTFSPDVDEEPSVFESEDSYIKKYPIVLPPKLPNTSETNLTKVLMHIHPPHRTIAPEIRYKRKQKVQRRRRSKRSPITSKHSMLRRLQIDAEEDVKKHRRRETENVPQRDCCHNGGKCYASHLPSQGDMPFLWCLCPPAFQGRFCEEDVNECSSLPCKPHERCIDEYGGFRCNCRDGFVREGDDCIPSVTCEEFPCLNGAECIDTDDGNFRCVCPLGFVGRICDTRVEECEDAACAKNKFCVSTETGFKCVKSEDLGTA